MGQTQNGKQIVQYLLGDLSAEEQRQLDDQLFVNDDYFERLLVTEDELIDDYLRGELSERERQLFERTFLSSPHLRQRVNLARSLLTYIDDKARLAGQSGSVPWYEPEKSRHKRQSGGLQILEIWLRQYKLYLVITALIRVTLLSSLSLLLFRVMRPSGSVELKHVVVVMWVSIICYVGLELLYLWWAVKVANDAIAEPRLRKTTPSER